MEEMSRGGFEGFCEKRGGEIDVADINFGKRVVNEAGVVKSGAERERDRQSV